MDPSVLAVSNLTVRRGRARILDRIDWAIRPGEHWAILGANGAGKTSLLKAITGYLAPTDGSITLLGHEYGTTDWRDLRLNVGIVTSSFASSVPPDEIAEDTVVSGRYAQLDLWKDVTRSDRTRARRLLREAGIGTVARREWGVLSQGERQRVLITRALMAQPRILILDEPCAGLDPVARASFLKYVDKLAVTHAQRLPPSTVHRPSLVLVTHHIEEITRHISHLLLLRTGRVLAAGPKSAILTRANLFRTFGARIPLGKPVER